MLKCSFPHCRSAVYSSGLCRGHYGQKERGEELRPKRMSKGTHKTCLVVGCSKPYSHNGMCAACAEACRRYGLSVVQYSMIKIMGCEVCGGSERLHIDHDHTCCLTKGATCGECVRGVLCQGCNIALGQVKENPARLRALANYMENHIG